VLEPLLKGPRIAPLVECPRCHYLSDYSSPTCLGCGNELRLTDDSVVHIVVQNTGAHYTPFFECPNCERLLRVGVSRCPDCYEEITEEYALSSAVAVVVNTIACDRANSIRSTERFAIIVALMALFIFVVDYTSAKPRLSYLVFLSPIVPLIVSVLWLYHFGDFMLGDDEYVKARRGVIRTFMLWGLILGAQLVAILILIFL
jgi:RNA polymerase subunit RPABC4/transcription elongation factor Spt4